MEVFLSALAGALAGSALSIVATVATLRATRSTALAAIRLQDALAAASELPIAAQQWMRSVQHMYGPLGRPGDDELQEVEALRRVRLQGLRHRVPDEFEAGPAIDTLLQEYNEWIMTWMLTPERSAEQLKLPDHLLEASTDLALQIPEIAKDLRMQLGEQQKSNDGSLAVLRLQTSIKQILNGRRKGVV